nr:hypothetical protein [Pantoea vagans]
MMRSANTLVSTILFIIINDNAPKLFHIELPLLALSGPGSMYVRFVPEASVANPLTHAKQFAVQLISVPHVKEH